MKRPLWAIFASLCLSAVSAFALSDDPTDATLPVPLVRYQSPFADYRPLGEDQSKPWKDANDTVRAIGGWRTYAREAAESAKTQAGRNNPAAPAGSPVLPPASMAPQSHKH